MDVSKKEMIVKTAVNYWAKFLENPNDTVFDNGPDSQASLFACAMATGSKKDTYTEKEIEDFKIELSKRLSDAIGNDIWPVFISVDYGPCSMLSESCKASLSKWSSMTLFPWKTSMRIDKESGSVYVSEGYRAPVVKLELEDL